MAERSAGRQSRKANLVLGLVSPAVASYIISYGGVFLLIFALMIVIRILISRWIAEAGLSVVDRLLGAGFGFLRGFLLIFVVYATCYYLITKDKFPDWAKNSVSVPILDSTLAWTRTHFDLDKMIEDRGNGIAIKLDKVDLDKLGQETGEAAKELKDEVKKEETEIQKAMPETPPAPVPTAPAPPVPPPRRRRLFRQLRPCNRSAFFNPAGNATICSRAAPSAPPAQ